MYLRAENLWAISILTTVILQNNSSADMNFYVYFTKKHKVNA